MTPPKNPPTDKTIPKECWIHPCHNFANKKFMIGNKEVLICKMHYKRFSKAKEQDTRKKKDFQGEIQ